MYHGAEEIGSQRTRMDLGALRLGPYLIGAWYRPQEQGEVESIKEVRREWEHFSKDAIGTIVVGDVNVHHKKWLRRSARNSAEGEGLH